MTSPTDHKQMTDAEVADLYLTHAAAGPPIGSRWRHRRSGGTYVVIAVALVESTLVPAVVYAGVAREGRAVWVRPLEQWAERFEQIGGQKAWAT